MRIHPIRHKLAQVGVLSVVLGAVILSLGLFPFAADLDTTPGVGITQLAAMLTGLFFLVLGAYIVVFAIVDTSRPRTLVRDIGVRLGMSGGVISAASALADVMGFGSHTHSTLFGWVQAGGVLVGFGISALGVVIFGVSYRDTKTGGK